MIPSFVAVRAPEGRCTPISELDAAAATGGQARVSGTDPRPTKVRWSTDTRRAISRGDLFLCRMDGTRVLTATEAAWDDSWQPAAALEAAPSPGKPDSGETPSEAASKTAAALEAIQETPMASTADPVSLPSARKGR